MKHTHFLCGSMTSWASFNISQSQPALACSFMSFESTEIFIKSDILAACFRTLDPFRKSFPSNILTAAFSNMDMAQLNQPHKRSWYLNQADGSTVRGGHNLHATSAEAVVWSFCIALWWNSSHGFYQYKNSMSLKSYSISVRDVWHTDSISFAEGSLECLMMTLLELPPVSEECKVEFLRLDDQLLVATLWEAWAHNFKMCWLAL